MLKFPEKNMNEKLLSMMEGRLPMMDDTALTTTNEVFIRQAVEKLVKFQQETFDDMINAVCTHLKLRCEEDVELAKAILQDCKTCSGLTASLSDQAYHYLKDVKNVPSLNNQAVALGDTLVYGFAEKYFREPEKVYKAPEKKTDTKKPAAKKDAKKKKEAKKEKKTVKPITATTAPKTVTPLEAMLTGGDKGAPASTPPAETVAPKPADKPTAAPKPAAASKPTAPPKPTAPKTADKPAKTEQAKKPAESVKPKKAKKDDGQMSLFDFFG